LPGQYYDEETGLHYNYHRYYDPRTGRYLRADPIGQIGGINLFLYAENNPINLVDPEGLFNPIKGASAIGNVFLSAFTVSSGSVKYGIAAGLLPASVTVVGSLPSTALAAWGTWNFKSSMAAWNRAVTQWEEALSEDFSEATWKNLYGLLPGGTEYDDPCESSGPVDYIRSQGWFSFLSEAGYF
jgi:RHS repeat-associated protein